MSLVDLIILGLAVNGAIEFYNHGEIFADLRLRGQETTSYFWNGISQCMFCLSPWIAGITCIIFLWLGGVFMLPIYAVAIARLAHLINDLTHEYNRSPDK